MGFKKSFLWVAVLFNSCLTSFANNTSDFGQLFIRVIDEKNTPMEINTIQIWTKTNNSSMGYSFIVKPTNNKGVYAIDNIPTGNYHALKIDQNGFAPFWKYDIKISQKNKEVITCKLSKGCEIKGRILNMMREPLSGIPVTINSVECRRDVVTDENGYFIAKHLLPTNYSIIAEPPKDSFYKTSIHKGLVSCDSNDVKIVLKQKDFSDNEDNTNVKQDPKTFNDRLELASLESQKKLVESLLNKPAPPLIIEKWYPNNFWDLDVKNKVILVDFWGVWCGPCKKDIPFLQYLHDKYSSNGLVVIGVHTPDKKEFVKEFMVKNNMTYLVGIDYQSRTASLYHISGYPTVCIIDRNGILRAVDPRKDEVEELIGSLLNVSSNELDKKRPQSSINEQ